MTIGQVLRNDYKRKYPEDEEVLKLKEELKDTKDRLAAATPRCCICEKGVCAPITVCGDHIACANCLDSHEFEQREKFKGQSDERWKCPVTGCIHEYGKTSAGLPHNEVLFARKCPPMLLGLCGPSTCRHCDEKLAVSDGLHVIFCSKGGCQFDMCSCFYCANQSK